MTAFDVSGAWDVHVHSAPSLFPRWGDGHELAAAAGEAGMGGVVLKAHHGSTVEAAAQLDRRLGTRVLGGLALNAFVGGLNPLAVERSVDLGAAIVWMPTIHARHHHRVLGCLGGFPFQDHPLRHTPAEGLSVLDDEGHLVEAAHDVPGCSRGSPTPGGCSPPTAASPPHRRRRPRWRRSGRRWWGSGSTRTGCATR